MVDIAGLVPCDDETVLGDGSDLRVYLMTRGATAVITELDPISGRFSRELDATSTLDMEGMVTGRLGEICCDGWDEVRVWATEILVYRDGRDAWAGPVTDVTFGYGRVNVSADDLTIWYDRRVLPSLSFAGKDFSEIFTDVHDAAMAPDPSPNFTVEVDQTNIRGSRSVLETQYVYAGDLIKELAKTALDYTAFGRRVIVRGEEVDVDPYITLFDDHWTEPPKVRERGMDQATVVVVQGNGVQSIAVADASYIDYYGYIVRTFDEPTIQDQASCDTAAQTRLDLLKDPVYIETPVGAQLKTSAPVKLDQLIPGTRIRLDTQATCRPLVSDFRLSKVEVNFNGDVAIDLQPIGTLSQILNA